MSLGKISSGSSCRSRQRSIRYIFDRFVKGQTANKIAQELNQMEKFTVNGKKWSASSILIVLRNEKYVGDIEMQKTITKDFLTHRSSINKGEAPRYYVKNHHVGIIDRVTWDKVQTMLFEKPRADMTKGPGKKKVKSIKGSPFGNLRCGAIPGEWAGCRKALRGGILPYNLHGCGKWLQR